MPAESSRAVFLSYASQDADGARRLCDALRAHGVEVWFDQNELVGGDAWDAKIRKQIAECALFVPIISAATQARREGYFRLEWKLAAQRTHMIADGTPFLLPVTIDETRDVEALVPAEFRAVQWTRLRAGSVGEADAGTMEREVGAFCGRVARLLAGPAAAAVAPRSGGRVDKSVRPGGEVPVRRVFRRELLPRLALVAIAAAVLVPWMTRRSAPEAGPAAGRKGADLTKETGPRAEARELTRKARALIDDDPLAVRESCKVADELLQRAITLAPDDGETWATLARVSSLVIRRNYETTVKRREAARSQVERARGLAPDSVETALARAEFLLTNRDYLAAEEILREWVTKAPTDVRVAISYAEALGRVRGRQSAREFRKTSPVLQADEPKWLALEAGSLRSGGSFFEALEMVNASLKLAPSRSAYGLKLLLLGVDLADHDEARTFLRSAPPQLLGEDVFVALGARIALWRGEPERALAILSKAPQDFFEELRRVEPKGYLMGHAMALTGKRTAAEEEWRGALTVLDRRLEAERNRPHYLRFKAVLHAWTGDRTEAEKAWQLFNEYRGLEPNLSRFDASLSRIEMLLALGEKEQAVQEFLAETSWANQRGGASVTTLRLDPWLEPLRADPRVQPLMGALAAAQEAKRRSAERPVSEATKQ